MNSHTPFDANQDWSNPYCQNRSNDPIVDSLLGNAYHVVRTIYCNLGNLKFLYDYLTTHGMVVGVQSEAELKALPKQFAKFARIYNFASTGDRQVTDYLYVDDDASGIKPDDPTFTGSWIKISVSGSTGGGEGSGDGAYIPYVYANGSAVGGETSFKVPEGTIGVPFLIINGSVKYIGFGFTYSAATATVTLSSPLVHGDEVIALTTAIPANPDNPEIPDWVQVNWLYNNGSAVGGEQVITVPYNFQDVSAVYKNGLRLYKGLQSNSYVIDPDNRTITMTEILNQGDRVIVTLGGESETLTITDRTLQEVARATNVKDSDVVLSTSTNVVITNKKVLYDVSAQKYWGLPDLPPNAYIVKVEGDKLTYNPGSVTVALIDKSDSRIEDESAAYTGVNIRQLIRQREEALSPTNNVVRFVTWNNQGANSAYQYYGNDYASRQRVIDLNDWYLRMGADFIGGQEHYTVPNLPNTAITMYPYQSGFHSNSEWFGTGRNYGNMVAATRPLKNSTSTKYSSAPIPDDPDNEYRSYIRTEMVVNGVTIAIYNTHLALTPSRITAMIAELAGKLVTETASHIVLMGDWNTQIDSDFQPLLNLGFTMVNKYGELNTNNIGGTWYLDRIFHKGFSKQGDFGVFNTPVSLGDHKPLYVDLTV